MPHNNKLNKNWKTIMKFNNKPSKLALAVSFALALSACTEQQKTTAIAG